MIFISPTLGATQRVTMSSDLSVNLSRPGAGGEPDSLVELAAHLSLGTGSLSVGL